MADSLKTQIGGNHYLDFKLQPIEFIVNNNLGFIEANIIKYICRYKHKNGVEDLKKIKHYIGLAKELENRDYSKFMVVCELQEEYTKYLINNAQKYCKINNIPEKEKNIIIKICLSICDIENRFTIFDEILEIVDDLIQEYNRE